MSAPQGWWIVAGHGCAECDMDRLPYLPPDGTEVDLPCGHRWRFQMSEQFPEFEPNVKTVAAHLVHSDSMPDEPTKAQKKAWAKAAAKNARQIAKTDQREARIREIVREEWARVLESDGWARRL